MKFKRIAFILTLSFFAIAPAFSGQMVFRDGDFNPNCYVEKAHPKIRARQGLIDDKSTTIHALNCNQNVISTVTMPSPVCGRYGQCSMPPLVQCGRSGCKSLVERVDDTINYDFNFNMLDMENLNTVQGEGIFGTVSKKSTANVFAERPLSTNYLAYSADGVLDKPIILVEGYDPRNNIHPNYYFNYGFNQLVYGGRDLFIVNFSDSTESLDKNAALLQKIILEINGAKTGNIPAVVIGYSMGGIVARKALKNMELAGIDHKTSLYVSFDAPHMGANAPLALEETVEGLISKLDSKTAGYTSSGLKRARHVYNSPAAREMLIAAPNFRVAKPSDFPQKLARVAVTSGSLLGSEGMQFNSVYEAQFIGSFKFYLFKELGITVSKTFEWYSKRRGALYYDNVPGSFEQQYRNAYLELKASAADMTTYNTPAAQNITFVPTVSSLALDVDPVAPLKGIFREKSPFDYYIAVETVGNMDPCVSFRQQSTDGRNLVHAPSYYEVFNSNQLEQLMCAIEKYQVPVLQIPDRSFKRY